MRDLTRRTVLLGAGAAVAAAAVIPALLPARPGALAWTPAEFPEPTTEPHWRIYGHMALSSPGSFPAEALVSLVYPLRCDAPGMWDSFYNFVHASAELDGGWTHVSLLELEAVALPDRPARLYVNGGPARVHVSYLECRTQADFDARIGTPFSESWVWHGNGLDADMSVKPTGPSGTRWPHYDEIVDWPAWEAPASWSRGVL